ncbi:YusW family protein [Oceanobacillus saliphilus]|uniref:YusW family protein n=1 Tax=Oceanobacillus saliphilus TaxID=2925834 RepID=UPI00201D6D03|nr:YusW family protein [Oceanobacillus saliphilus]
MKKKLNTRITLILLSLVLLLLLAACGADNENVEENEVNQEFTDSPEESNTIEAENDAIDDSKTTSKNENHGNESAYPFVSFELEADFEGTNDAVDVEYELDGERIEASYIDKLKGIQLSGDEAMAELDNIFTSFGFDKDSPEDEVLSEVLEAFNIPEDADKVEIEIEFTEGNEIEYNH